MAVKFYSPRKDYGFFSNFSKHPIFLKGRVWATTEHYFQAQKYVGTLHYLKIAKADTPRQAATLGRDRSLPLREDWEEVKDSIMKECVFAKVLIYPGIKQALMNTGDEDIIEDSPIDYYWGCGKDGSGKNMLGKIFMEIREELRNKEK
jgi:N-glycosidase YbiA